MQYELITEDDRDSVTVDAGEDSIAGDGRVRVFALANEVTISEELPCVVLDVAPAEARALAAALLRAADEAEGLEEPRLILRPVPEDKVIASAKERMRTHVYVNVSATDRNPGDRGYRRVGYRLFAPREAWYGASDEERERAVNEAVRLVATKAGQRPESARGE